MGIFGKFLGKNRDTEGGCWLYAPMEGMAVAMEEVPDPAFSRGMLGRGIAIVPEDGRVWAPCDGIVDTMFQAGHAVSLIGPCGAEILIHVGLETVSLKGEPFRAHVSSGDRVKRGQLLMEADLEAIRASGRNPVTPIVVCNSGAFSHFACTVGRKVTREDPVVEFGK